MNEIIVFVNKCILVRCIQNTTLMVIWEKITLNNGSSISLRNLTTLLYFGYFRANRTTYFFLILRIFLPYTLYGSTGRQVLSTLCWSCVPVKCKDICDTLNVPCFGIIWEGLVVNYIMYQCVVASGTLSEELRYSLMLQLIYISCHFIIIIYFECFNENSWIIRMDNFILPSVLNIETSAYVIV